MPLGLFIFFCVTIIFHFSNTVEAFNGGKSEKPWTQAAVDLDPGVGGVQWSFQVENSESNIYLDEIELSRTACECFINTSRGNIYLLLSYKFPLPVNYSASTFDMFQRVSCQFLSF